MTTVVCDDDAKINLLLDKAPSCLKRLVYFRELKRETIARAKKQGMELFKFEEIERLGSANSHIHREKVVVRIAIQKLCVYHNLSFWKQFNSLLNRMIYVPYAIRLAQQVIRKESCWVMKILLPMFRQFSFKWESTSPIDTTQWSRFYLWLTCSKDAAK